MESNIRLETFIGGYRLKTSILSHYPSNAGRSKHMQAVIFDLDGILIDTEWISYQVWAQIAAEYGGDLTKESYPGMIGLTAEETGEYVMRSARVSFDLAPTVARVWKTVTERINTGIEPMHGAAQLLTALAQRGYPLAIASNSPTGYIENALNGMGLRSYFRETVGIDQVQQGKPAPDVYLRAAQRLDVPPGRCLAIEDSYVGSQAALQAGMRVLAVPARQDRPEKFSSCFGIYESLVEVRQELDGVLNHAI
jgi:HAD superfamily hydrolase (TIGR01509 family)